jgi:peptidoglycan hydrolase CwlO-like protein
LREPSAHLCQVAAPPSPEEAQLTKELEAVRREADVMRSSNSALQEEIRKYQCQMEQLQNEVCVPK